MFNIGVRNETHFFEFNISRVLRDTCPKKFHAVHFLLLPILAVAVYWFTIIIIPGLVFAVRWCSVMELVWCAAAAAG